MKRIAKKSLSWSELAGLAMLGVLVLFGLAANGRILPESLVSLAFLAGVLLIAWLWQRTLRRAESAPPLTRRQRTWSAAVFVAWLAVMGLLLWCYYKTGITGSGRNPEPRAIPIDPEEVQLE